MRSCVHGRRDQASTDAPALPVVGTSQPGPNLSAESPRCQSTEGERVDV